MIQIAAPSTQPIVDAPVAASNTVVAHVTAVAPAPVRLATAMQPTKSSAPIAAQLMPAPSVVAASGAIAAAPSQAAISEGGPQPATVKYAGGLLSIQANDANLSQILRQVSQLTGMVITGAVPEERVFGNYGPARPSTIIAKLLDGIDSNMVLREGPDATVAELILTPRNGAATPPKPPLIAAEASESSEANEAQIDLAVQSGLIAAKMRAESRAAGAAHHPIPPPN
jgi:hypothetical protein